MRNLSDRWWLAVTYAVLVGVVAFLSWDVDQRLTQAQNSRCKLDDAITSIVFVQALGDIAQAEESGTPYPTESLTIIEATIERIANVLIVECVNAGADIEVNIPDDFDLDGDGK